MDHQPQQSATSRRRYRFGVLGVFIVLLVVLLAALACWVAATGFHDAFASTGFQYLGLAAIIAGLGTATRATARLVENGVLVDKPNVMD